MPTPQLLVDPAKLAVKLGIVDPSQSQLDSVTDAILDAQADVESALHRPLFPVERTLTGITPNFGWELDDWQAWTGWTDRFDDTIAVKTVTPAVDGDGYDVVFLVGLNGPAERPIVRYTTAHALRGLREEKGYGFTFDPVVTSLSAEGQSIQFAARPTDAGVAGSVPNISTLNQYKRRAVFRADRAPVSLWPNRGGTYMDRR